MRRWKAKKKGFEWLFSCVIMLSRLSCSCSLSVSEKIALLRNKGPKRAKKMASFVTTETDY
jgi:hypothetical protein